MVSRSDKKHSQCHGKEYQDVCQGKEVVKRLYQRTQNDGRGREKEKTELEGGCAGEGRAEEVDPVVQEKNVGPLVADHWGSQGVECGMIRERSSGDDCGDLNRQGGQSSEHIIRDGTDAEARILSPEQQ